jgi:hypothetical protein
VECTRGSQLQADSPLSYKVAGAWLFRKERLPPRPHQDSQAASEEKDGGRSRDCLRFAVDEIIHGDKVESVQRREGGVSCGNPDAVN